MPLIGPALPVRFSLFFEVVRPLCPSVVFGNVALQIAHARPIISGRRGPGGMLGHSSSINLSQFKRGSPMIRLIEALNFRCLRYVRQPLGPFHMLVGPNASGKTSFLDVLAFLGRLVDEGVDKAVRERTDNFHDLVWGRQDTRFELAIEAAIPDEFQTPTDSPYYDIIRYEVALGLTEDTNEFGIVQESLLLGEEKPDSQAQTNRLATRPGTLFQSRRQSRWTALIQRGPKNEYHLTPEARQKSQGDYWIVGRPDRSKTVFRQLNEEEFPASTWLESFLTNGINRIDLTGTALRRPSPPGKGIYLWEDGSNLPWQVSALKRHHPERFKAWLGHIRTALPDVQTIRIVEKPEDRHRYLMLRQTGGLEVPSWMLSDGTLRLLALTGVAYLGDSNAIYLVEEPETSLHPMNIEVVMQSLQSVYDGQVLVATQSPAALLATKLENILVFARDPENGTQINAGDHHPALRDWKGQPNLDVLFASGVLG
jgi:predicted ATPase